MAAKAKAMKAMKAMKVMKKAPMKAMKAKAKAMKKAPKKTMQAANNDNSHAGRHHRQWKSTDWYQGYYGAWWKRETQPLW